jgi:hypothetical protein
MRKVKDILPFVFPLAALLLVGVLAVRWYNLRNQQVGQVSEFAEGVEIENLSESEREKVMRGAGDGELVNLQKETDDETVMGELRYELGDDKVLFTVNATLPELTEGMYQVWLKDVDSDSMKKAFVLEMGKGGYTGSASISKDTVPFEVIVSKEMTDDQTWKQLCFEAKLKSLMIQSKKLALD